MSRGTRTAAPRGATAARHDAPPRRTAATRARAAWLATALLAAVSAAEAATVALRILETTDVHMHLVDWDYHQDKPTDEFGLARTATLVTRARAEARNTLLFDNGDLLQGSPMGDFVARVKPFADGTVHPAYRVLRLLGVDAANLGNHEFNFGLPFVQRAVRSAPFPVVSANVRIDDGDGDATNDAPLFTPWVILPRQVTDTEGRTHTLKVGVIGFVPPQILTWDRQHLLGKVTVHDIVETARAEVPKMRAAGAQVVVAIPHSGFERSATTPRFAENSVARLAEVPGIDAILFGHSHGEFPGEFFRAYPGVDLARGTIGGVPAVMPGRWGDHLGVVDLTLDDASGAWKVVDSRAELRPIRDRATRKPLVDADPRVAALVADEHRATLEWVRSPLATSDGAFTSYFAQVQDDASVQVVAEAQAAYVRRAVQGTEFESLPLLSAAAPFRSGGRQGWSQYTDIAAGPLALRHAADLYVYPNTVKAVRIDGAQLREWLEMSAGQFARIDPAGPAAQPLLNDAYRSYNFDTVEGVAYRIDVTQPARYDANGKLVAPDARRIVELRWNGVPVRDDQRFLVATNNYRASGGGNFPGLDGSQVVVDAPDENRTALVEHLRAVAASGQRVSPRADGNWAIVPVPGVSLRFRSGAGGIAHLAANPAIRLVERHADGSATYELMPAAR